MLIPPSGTSNLTWSQFATGTSASCDGHPKKCMLIRTPTSANVATTTPIATLTTTRRMENLRPKPITHAAADATAR